MPIFNSSNVINVTIKSSATAEPQTLIVTPGTSYADILANACITAGKNVVLCDGEELTDLSGCPEEDCELLVQPKKYQSGSALAE